MRPWRVLLVLLLLGAGLVLWSSRKRHARNDVTERAAPAGKDLQVPVLQAGEEEALSLEVETERKPGERRLRLRTRGGAGAVRLTMRDPDSRDDHGIGFGKAVLQPDPDRARGAALVQAVARWLDAPLPEAAPTGELGPFSMNYVFLGAKDGWEANKLFFERGDRYAELFLNLSADGRHARLLEKDEDYRKDLLALLSLVLRDGLPPRRTPANDPLVAAMAPLFKDFQPLAGMDKPRAIVGLPEGFLAGREIVRDGRRASELLRWSAPGPRPQLVASCDGVISGLVVSPRGDRAGLSVVYPKGARGLSSADPGMLAVVDLASGNIGKLQDTDKFAFDFAGAFSPDGSRVAVASGNVTRVYDIASRRLLASTPAAMQASPLRWGADGLLLFHVRYDPSGADDEGESLVSYYRWRPGSGDPRPAQAPRLQSPDTRHRLEANKDGVVINGPGGTKRLAMSRPDDLNAFLALREVDGPKWLGPEQVVVHLEEPMALDLTSGKLHYLFATPGLRFEAATPDGRIVVARDDKDHLVWARR